MVVIAVYFWDLITQKACFSFVILKYNQQKPQIIHYLQHRLTCMAFVL